MKCYFREKKTYEKNGTIVLIHDQEIPKERFSSMLMLKHSL